MQFLVNYLNSISQDNVFAYINWCLHQQQHSVDAKGIIYYQVMQVNQLLEQNSSKEGKDV